MSARKKKQPIRGYALTPWSKALLAVIDQPSDVRRVNKARSYFRDRQVMDLRVRPGVVTAMVQGSQLDPFEVELTTRTVDSDTVLELLARADATPDLMAVARGEQPKILGELIIPTESADIRSACSCPDETVRCIHVLATSYELTTVIDDNPAALLTMMGADLGRLLATLRGTDENPSTTPSRRRLQPPTAALPPLPQPPPIDPFTELDATKLAAALRASGTNQLDIAESIDELAELYLALRRSGG
ncbi:SWIM zinc finger family protein [Jongsikchunia kroppenstedtii]|uniref:SWIM zinc finger family protein n=1 Tax=Jongsikchunia kroppenstedtii TaxID=1121721 RepID=UPI00037D402B|nr:hypothetical protein [Jongsikchunia kroppenstedtii]